MQVITNRIAACTDKRVFDANRFNNAFAAYDGFLEDTWLIVRGWLKRLSESFECNAVLYNGCRASSDIVYGIMKMVGYIAPVDDLFWRWINFDQMNRMHPELGAVSGNKQCPINSVQEISEYGDSNGGQGANYNAKDVEKIILRRTLIYILSLFGSVLVAHFAYEVGFAINRPRRRRSQLWGNILLVTAFIPGGFGCGLLLVTNWSWSWGWFL